LFYTAAHRCIRLADMPPAKPSRTEYRALRLLAESRNGCTEAVMLAHGFTVEILIDIVRVGLAIAQTERVVARGAVDGGHGESG
jgi:hypothetical protein